MFIEDDYGKAISEAKAKGRPLFIDVWAPWCHTCLSLKSFVLSDPIVAEYKDRFTWLAIDSEKSENADVVKRLDLAVLPTLYVVDPTTEKPTWTWKGSLTAKELVAAITDDAVANASTAAKLDRDVNALADAKKWDECVALAKKEGPQLPEGTYRVDIAATGAHCADEAKKAETRAAIPAFIAELKTLTASHSPAVLADDRSSAFETLVDLQKTAKDAGGAKKSAADWAAFLEARAEEAKTPTERAVFDPHRLGAYLALGEPARAIPMLEATERDFPQDYNPPARKARALLEMGKPDDAIVAIDRALGLAYGGRKLRLYILKADILAKKKDPAGERAALTEAMAFGKGIPLTPGYQRLLATIEARAKTSERAAPSAKRKP